MDTTKNFSAIILFHLAFAVLLVGCQAQNITTEGPSPTTEPQPENITTISAEPTSVPVTTELPSSAVPTTNVITTEGPDPGGTFDQNEFLLQLYYVFKI